MKSILGPAVPFSCTVDGFRLSIIQFSNSQLYYYVYMALKASIKAKAMVIGQVSQVKKKLETPDGN